MSKELECNSDPLVKLFTYHTYPLSIISTERFIGEKKLSFCVDLPEEAIRVDVENSRFTFENGRFELFAHEYADGVKAEVCFVKDLVDTIEIKLDYIQNTQAEEYILFEFFDEVSQKKKGSVLLFRNNKALVQTGKEKKEKYISFEKLEKFTASFVNNEYVLYITTDGNKEMLLDMTCNDNSLKMRMVCFLGGNQYYDWLFSNFIQLYGRNMYFSSYIVDFFVEPEKEIEMMYTLHPFIEFHHIDKKVLKRANIDYIHFIEANIDEERYVEVVLDQQYIKESGYNKYFIHQTLIYGYSKDEEFYILIFDKNGKTKKTVISYQDFRKAIEIKYDRIVCLKYSEPSRTYSLNRHVLKESLEDYLSGKDWNRKFSPLLQNDSYKTEEPRHERELRRVPNVNGFSLYDFFIDNPMFFNYLMNDVRVPYAMKEHKYLMVERIKFLIIRNVISKDKSSEIVRKADELYKDATLLVMLWLKESHSENKRYEENVRELLRKMRDEEKALLEELIELI